MPHHQIAEYLAPNTYALLKALSVALYGLILMMYLCTTVNLECGIGSDQWSIRVLFECLFYVSLDFHCISLHDLDH